MTIKRDEVSNKNINEFIVSKSSLAKTGKIIIKNNNFVTIQQGRPYFFPNCKTEGIRAKTNLQYKIVPSNRIISNWMTNRNVSLNYYNILKLSVKESINNLYRYNSVISLKSEFSKLFIKNHGKLYSCLMPQFFKKFSIATFDLSKFPQDNFFRSNLSRKIVTPKIDRTLLLQSSKLISNETKINNPKKKDYQLTLVKFVEQPFLKSTKAIGLYSITEDYFEQEVNSVFCKNTEFIEAGKTIGLLNLEKEITGDIVQGLPRIEEILEARKKNLILKQ